MKPIPTLIEAVAQLIDCYALNESLYADDPPVLTLRIAYAQQQLAEAQAEIGALKGAVELERTYKVDAQQAAGIYRDTIRQLEQERETLNRQLSDLLFVNQLQGTEIQTLRQELKQIPTATSTQVTPVADGATIPPCPHCGKADFLNQQARAGHIRSCTGTAADIPSAHPAFTVVPQVPPADTEDMSFYVCPVCQRDAFAKALHQDMCLACAKKEAA